MKTHNKINKLVFAKNDIAELNHLEMLEINGGSTIMGGETCTGCVCLSAIRTIMQIEAL
ncbi:class I lanthipeptide [Flavobacterium cerinum]|uniref:Class I lanthipeptide n=1 Tax=Flavobacterium cerinum TaxID=2502784 RepID=A0ABY5ITT5_9FLAO|nr:class I lanthipeptide [Flavobacterium cerinum]UUC46209.1 class I lanthipeptide [Flavobacterium cerinum]